MHQNIDESCLNLLWPLHWTVRCHGVKVKAHSQYLVRCASFLSSEHWNFDILSYYVKEDVSAQYYQNTVFGVLIDKVSAQNAEDNTYYSRWALDFDSIIILCESKMCRDSITLEWAQYYFWVSIGFWQSDNTVWK